MGCPAKRSWPGTSERRPDEMRAHAEHLWEKSKGNKTSKNVRLGPQQVQRSFVSVLELFENTARRPEAGNGVMGDGTDGVLVPLKSM